MTKKEELENQIKELKSNVDKLSENKVRKSALSALKCSLIYLGENLEDVTSASINNQYQDGIVIKFNRK